MNAFTIREALTFAKTRLAAVTDQPILEAECLLAHTLQSSRAHLHAWPERYLTLTEQQQYSVYLNRRLKHEPIAYLTGTKEFWSLSFSVTPDTLIPRPETELLVETALSLIPAAATVTVADLGTGCGTIALAIAHERRQWQIYATDSSENTLLIARKNAQQLMLDNVSFSRGNWCTALSRHDFNMIISNPPYIAAGEWAYYQQGLCFEPEQALVSGLDGLAAIRTISETARLHLACQGYLLLEHGFLQGQAVREILSSNGYQRVRSVNDLSGLERVTIGYWPASATY